MLLRKSNGTLATLNNIDLEPGNADPVMTLGVDLFAQERYEKSDHSPKGKKRTRFANKGAEFRRSGINVLLRSMDIDSVTPAIGPVTAGTPIVVRGKNLDRTDESSAGLGWRTGQSYTGMSPTAVVISPTEVRLTTDTDIPAGANLEFTLMEPNGGIVEWSAAKPSTPLSGPPPTLSLEDGTPVTWSAMELEEDYDSPGPLGENLYYQEPYEASDHSPQGKKRALWAAAGTMLRNSEIERALTNLSIKSVTPSRGPRAVGGKFTVRGTGLNFMPATGVLGNTEGQNSTFSVVKVSDTVAELTLTGAALTHATAYIEFRFVEASGVLTTWFDPAYGDYWPDL